MTAVCVKTWPFDVWITKERLDDEEGLEGVEEVGVEEVVEGATTLEDPDDEALAEELEEDELTTELVELGGFEDDGVVEEDVGVALGVRDVAGGALVADATGVLA